VVRCELDGESFEPLGDQCIFPIDLLEDRPSIELVRWRDGRRETVTVRVGAYPYRVERLTIADDSKVHLSTEDLARADEESERISTLWNLRRPRLFALPLRAPLDKLPVGSRFGSRRFINGEPRSPHSGVDFSASTGTPVLAAAGGEVVLAEDHFFAGNSVFLDHGDGLVSMYFHLSAIGVSTGQLVRAGETIGAVGATGRATGPHLHFGLRWRGARIDPLPLLGLQPLPEVGSR